MTLPSGTRLGPYEISAPLGAGGMGDVYRARDPRLGRDVAVKTLPAAAANDPERVARFAREAQILAGLNHPHIAALYGLEESASGRFLIMELVEGGTLAARLESGPIDVRDALAIARQVADALHTAHERGIIHRDLKPANIAFTPSGDAKVLDFGVAKAFSADSDSATEAGSATRSGVVLGTAAYMSPEQARGLLLDKRTDIFSFGCVLFEMLTGRNPFAGGSVSDVVVAILGRDPEWSALPSNTPLRVQWLLRRCLDKDPKRRLHDIADARIELDEALAEPRDSGSGPAAALRPAPSPTRRRESIAWGMAVLGVASLATALWLRAGNQVARPADGQAYRTSIVIPATLRLDFDPSSRFALSPDGRKIAFAGAGSGGSRMLWIRPLDSAVAQPLAGTEGASYPFWSADSGSIGFTWRLNPDATTGAGKLKIIGIGGGEAETLADVAFRSTATWSREGLILFTPGGTSPLEGITLPGGSRSSVTTLDTAAGHVQHTDPSFLPDGRHFLFTAVGSRGGGATAAMGVYVASLDASKAARLLLEGASHAKFANGHLLFLRGATLMTQPFDADRLELLGVPAMVAEQVQTAGSGGGVAGAYSVSAAGTLAYQTASLVRSRLAWFDRSGKETGTLGELADYVDVVLSPDGRRLATSIVDPQLGTRDIWLFEVTRGIGERFTLDPSDDFAPVWSPRGDRLIFSSAGGGRIDLFQKSGPTGAPQRIDDRGLALGKFAASWSPHERSILFIAGGRAIARSDLMLLPVDGGAAETFLGSPFIETQGRFSPDGRWIAYASNVTGRLETYVSPFGRAGDPQRVSVNGGQFPLWRRDGEEIVFLGPDGILMSAAVRTTAGQLTVGEIRRLFPIRIRPQVRLDAYPYAITPDGLRFLVNTFVEEPNTSSPLTLLINWPAALKK